MHRTLAGTLHVLGVAAICTIAVSGCGPQADQKRRRGPAGPVNVESLPTRSLDLGGGVTLELIRVPPGRVRIGSPKAEPGRDAVEGPQHVEQFAGFWIGKYEVTQRQWQQVMGENPAQFHGEDHPVEWVDPTDLVVQVHEFCRRVSRRTGQTVRLPTEAEWEYACRAPKKAEREPPAGSAGPFNPPVLPAYSFGADDKELADYGWVDLSGAQTHPVGKLAPNRFGLYDMHGNVAELCSDKYEPYGSRPATGAHFGKGYSVTRGGSWATNRAAGRCAARDFLRPALATSSVGFRVVCPMQ
jgi:formylglycine-generating enzyme required for sulfatase activity